MLKTAKKVLIVALCLLCLPATAPTYASTDTPADPNDIILEWVNLQNAMLSMSYSSGKVNWAGQLIGKTNTASMSATFRLYKQSTNGSYSLIATSPLQSTSSMLISYSNSTTTSKGTFKLTVTGTVTNTSGSSEIISDSFIKTFS